jgi:hypothetical protein
LEIRATWRVEGAGESGETRGWWVTDGESVGGGGGGDGLGTGVGEVEVGATWGLEDDGESGEARECE